MVSKLVIYCAISMQSFVRHLTTERMLWSEQDNQHDVEKPLTFLFRSLGVEIYNSKLLLNSHFIHLIRIIVPWLESYQKAGLL